MAGPLALALLRHQHTWFLHPPLQQWARLRRGVFQWSSRRCPVSVSGGLTSCSSSSLLSSGRKYKQLEYSQLSIPIHLLDCCSLPWRQIHYESITKFSVMSPCPLCLRTFVLNVSHSELFNRMACGTGLSMAVTFNDTDRLRLHKEWYTASVHNYSNLFMTSPSENERFAEL